MNYEIKSSIRKSKFAGPLKVVTIIIIILVILHFIAPNLLPSFFTSIAKPFWNIGIGDRPDISLLSIDGQNNIISQLQKENKELKEQLGRPILKNSLLAYILKKPPFTVYDSFILDVGTNQGVAIGDKVYSFGDILIGEILEVSPSVSKVKLYSSYGEKYEVLIGEKNVQATATGRGGGSFEIVIPRDIKVAEDDSITIPNISNTVFGTIGEIIAEPARAFSTVIFSQPINIYEQKWVLISIKK
jgi:hypothetical protein